MHIQYICACNINILVIVLKELFTLSYSIDLQYIYICIDALEAQYALPSIFILLCSEELN